VAIMTAIGFSPHSDGPEKHLMQYVFVAPKESAVSISATNTELVGFVPQNSIQKNGDVEWGSVSGVVTGWAKFSLDTSIKIECNGNQYSKQVHLNEEAKSISIKISSSCDIDVKILDRPQDLD
jgi:hypothetical protein